MKRQLAKIALTGLVCVPMLTTALTASAQRSPEPEDRNPAQRPSVILTVIKAKALSKFDRKIPFTKKHRPDFYLLTSVNTKKGVTRSRRKNNQNNPTFNHRLSTLITNELKPVRFQVRLVDSDHRLERLRPYAHIGRLGYPHGDDLADIASASNTRVLAITYSPKSRKVFINNRYVGRAGQAITVRGDAKKHRASLTFKIDQKNR